MNTLRFIKRTFWIDVLLLVIAMLWLSACEVVHNPAVYERNNTLDTRGKDLPRP